MSKCNLYLIYIYLTGNGTLTLKYLSTASYSSCNKMHSCKRPSCWRFAFKNHPYSKKAAWKWMTLHWRINHLILLRQVDWTLPTLMGKSVRPPGPSNHRQVLLLRLVFAKTTDRLGMPEQLGKLSHFCSFMYPSQNCLVAFDDLRYWYLTTTSVKFPAKNIDRCASFTGFKLQN